MASGKFKPQSEEACLSAIGLARKESKSKTDETRYSFLYRNRYGSKQSLLSYEFLNALIPNPDIYPRVPKPGREDWLACHSETGQSFLQFTESHRNRVRPNDTIYILPLTFFENCVPDNIMQALTKFAAIFFNLPVKIIKTKNVAKKVSSRVNEYTGNHQVNAQEILQNLEKVVPRDAYCLSAITLCDLYPRDSWNFVFGLASLANRVGVYSLARYLPGFGEGDDKPVTHMSREELSVLLKHSCLLMVHEMGHMFGLKHCIYFHCLMNGSNHFEENDKKPLHLCPVCLRKLHFAINFDVTERYRLLLEFAREHHMETAAEWYHKRLETFAS